MFVVTFYVSVVADFKILTFQFITKLFTNNGSVKKFGKKHRELDICGLNNYKITPYE